MMVAPVGAGALLYDRTVTLKISFLLTLALLMGPCAAYIPAVATNFTLGNATAGVNDSTNGSSLSLRWFPMGSVSQEVSYLLSANDSDGVSMGALVRFSEEGLTNDTTTTPWIALVSCDSNATNTDLDVDIFTLAWERGAVSALLYSEKSQTCVIDPWYMNTTEFNRIMDIYATQSLPLGNLVYNQFAVLINSSLYESFNATRLNESVAVIDKAITKEGPVGPGYLFATLTAFNATDPDNSTTGQVGSDGLPYKRSPGGSSLAMIVLYAITGCVSALFAVVIITGVIRAIRHPERYATRHMDNGSEPGHGAGHSRRRVITRAILDTFPVIKFYKSTDPNSPDDGPMIKDLEESESSPGDIVKMGDLLPGSEITEDAPTPLWIAPLVHRGEESVENESGSAVASGSGSPPASPHPRPQLSIPSESDKLMPSAIGRETCPICIVDFEEGDDLRVLPCEGKHQFHQQCVDPWLLELSGSCPLCRQDFHILESMMEGSPNNLNRASTSGQAEESSNAPRFSRYLRFAQRRRIRNRHPNRASYATSDRRNSHGIESAVSPISTQEHMSIFA